jgi:TonB family protein
MLRSVTIVKLLVNNHGHTTGSNILRSAGLAEFDQVVMQSIQAASPLPAPRAEWLNKQGAIEFTETWLMRDDKRFQLRSVGAPQACGSC